MLLDVREDDDDDDNRGSRLRMRVRTSIWRGRFRCGGGVDLSRKIDRCSNDRKMQGLFVYLVCRPGVLVVDRKAPAVAYKTRVCICVCARVSDPSVCQAQVRVGRWEGEGKRVCKTRGTGRGREKRVRKMITRLEKTLTGEIRRVSHVANSSKSMVAWLQEGQQKRKAKK
ncbi:hypothetical protein LZ32DRAFT_171489 [Colletotrichum eremochloae]|nr:hypothetical protein LZ32DRAFT_171489 [Colletotrichum eremochloae]